MAAFGRPRGSSAYDAAAATRRTQNWTPSTADINNIVFSNLESLRSRSRDMVRKNAWASNALDSFVGNCVGTGIKPRSQHPNDALRKEIHHLWNRWTDEADADGLADFYGLQSLICREMVEAGECIVRFRPRHPSDGLAVPLQLQGLESEHLPVSMNRLLEGGRYIRGGIEFDRIGKRAAYHLYRQHPGDSLFGGAGEPVPVPAASVMHVFRPVRLGQLRGVPWMAQVLVKLYELDQYDDAELVRKKIAAMFAGFITKNSPEDNVTGQDDDAAADESGRVIAGLEPGTLQVLFPGEDIKFAEPADVGAAYEAFLRSQLRAVAAGIGITYEQLTGDLTGVNYSSIRAGLLEFRRRLEQFQHQVMVFQFCRPVWRAFVQSALLAGALDANSNDADLYAVKWHTPGFDWVDPLKDIKGKLQEVRGGFASRAQVVAGRGYDVEEIDAEIAADNQRADSLGLTFDSDGRQKQGGGEQTNETSDAPGNAAV